MDNYIKLCAEMAYNDVLMESYFEEDLSLNEAENNSIIENLKKAWKAVIEFCKNVWKKVSGFIKEKIDVLKDKYREWKAKHAKHENASLYNNLMEMVLTEEEKSESINWFYVYEKLQPTLADCTTNIMAKFDKLSGEANELSRKLIEADSQSKIDMILDDVNDLEEISVKFNGHDIYVSGVAREIDSYLDSIKKESVGKDSKGSEMEVLTAIKKMEADLRYFQADITPLDKKDMESQIDRIKKYELEEDDKLVAEKVKGLKALYRKMTSVWNSLSVLVPKIDAIMFMISIKVLD